MSRNLNRRYPGVKPFETEDRAIFFGREGDLRNLLDLIAIERLVVLYGKSGHGKSSLIRAGLIPYYQDANPGEPADRFIPLMVRFGSYSPAGLSPIEHLLGRLNEITDDPSEIPYLQNALPHAPLWYHFKKRQSQSSKRYLLIFDQFEEFFTYPGQQQILFLEQLAELIYNDTPQPVREIARSLDEDQRRFLADPLEIKMLLAIRSDRMSMLDGLKTYLPAILHKCYELRELDPDQAREAIARPARQPGDFASQPFSFSEPALQVIVATLSKSSQNRPVGIEAFELQVLCEYLEEEIIAGRINARQIEPGHFSHKIDEIFENYYKRMFARLPAYMREAAQHLIENELVFEDRQSGESRRLSVDGQVLIDKFSGTADIIPILQALENAFLLRREPNSGGGFSYEVSHDTLLPSIMTSRRQREIREEADRRLKQARRRQRRLLMALGSSILVFLVTASLGVYVLNLRNKAQTALARAQAEQQKTEQALRDVQAAQAAREKTEFGIRLQNVVQILKGNNCPPETLLKDIREMQRKYPDDPKLQQQIKKINRQLSDAKCI